MRLLWAVAISLCAAAQSDWTQFGGPSRNFMVDAPNLVEAFPAKGPAVLWQRPLGEGYSGLAVSDGLVYTMFLRGMEDILTAIDARTGKAVWEHAISRETTSHTDFSEGRGPHSTPLVVGGRVFAINTAARMVALDAKSGKLIWQHDFLKEYDGERLDRGYSASPLAWNDTVIAPVGGKAHSLVAFRQKDGSIAWQKGDFTVGFSSPTLINMSGLTQLVLFFAEQVAAFNPDNGDPQWTVGHKTDWGLNISVPVYGDDGIMVLTSAYSGGARGVQLTRNGTQTRAKEIWTQRKFRVHHGDAVRLGDYIYGSSGDFGPAPLTCLNVKDGSVVWQDRGLGKSSLLWTGKQMILLSEDGELALANISPQGLKIKSRASIFHSRAWTPPSLVNGVLYARDRSALTAVDLRAGTLRSVAH